MKQISLEVDGQQRSAFVQKLGETLWVHLDGETFTYEPEKKGSRRKKAGAFSSASDVAAPMPGKITKVAASEGARVNEGQLLIVLEAMKMEYSLKASMSGTVKSIKCGVGDQVTLGQLLVEVTPEGQA
jgi:acetyl/propionyl-CoA carboxylase alpha subunit